MMIFMEVRLWKSSFLCKIVCKIVWDWLDKTYLSYIWPMKCSFFRIFGESWRGNRFASWLWSWTRMAVQLCTNCKKIGSYNSVWGLHFWDKMSPCIRIIHSKVVYLKDQNMKLFNGKVIATIKQMTPQFMPTFKLKLADLFTFTWQIQSELKFYLPYACTMHYEESNVSERKNVVKAIS